MSLLERRAAVSCAASVLLRLGCQARVAARLPSARLPRRSLAVHAARTWLQPSHRQHHPERGPQPHHVPCSGATLVSEFDLICGRRWLLYCQQSAFFVSVLAGCLAWQLSADRYSACAGAACRRVGQRRQALPRLASNRLRCAASLSLPAVVAGLPVLTLSCHPPVPCNSPT